MAWLSWIFNAGVDVLSNLVYIFLACVLSVLHILLVTGLEVSQVATVAEFICNYARPQILSSFFIASCYLPVNPYQMR